MNEQTACFRLHSRVPGAPAPALVGVQAQGRLDAVLYELTLRQTYRNTSREVLEVVYSFPLPAQAVMLGFASELNGQRMVSQVVDAQRAERQYEQALAEGDAPVLLQSLGDGLHSANIGNLKPGDEIVLEVRLAQLQTFEQGRLRLSLPTTVAPRYGNPMAAGLQPQQVPEASLEVDYPLSFELTIGAALAGAALECPTHPVSVTALAGGEKRLSLAPGARLDRDVVVIVTPLETRPSLLVQAEDALDAAAPVIMMAALQMPPQPQREAIAVKLLVDCSGSMAGDSIASARRALWGVLSSLAPGDRMSLQRFGADVQTLFEPTDVKPQTLRFLRPLIESLQADLGGTEIGHALASTLALQLQAADGQGADILLITDGEVWPIEALIAQARRGGQRIFVIGVGASIADSGLRRLAGETHGACEFVTPGEAMEQAAQRMLRRMRQKTHARIQVDWGSEPVWIAQFAPDAFAGDTVVAIAGLKAPPRADTVRLVAPGADGQPLELSRVEAQAPCPGDALARLAAARRISGSTPEAAKELALRYQLLGPQTHAILVHQRAQEDQAVDAARLHRVPSMLAAGWGGVGTVAGGAAGSVSYCASEGDPFADRMFGRRRDASEVFKSAFDLPFGSSAGSGGMGAGAAFDFENAPSPQMAMVPQPVSLAAGATTIAEGLARGRLVAELPALCCAVEWPAEVHEACAELRIMGLDDASAWLLLVHWVNSRPGGLALALLTQRLATAVAAIEPATVATALAALERRLGGLADAPAAPGGHVGPWPALFAGS